MDQCSFSVPQLLNSLLVHPAAILDVNKKFIAINSSAEEQFFCCAKNQMIGKSLAEYIANFDQASILLTEQHQLFYFHPTTKKNYTIQLDAFPSNQCPQFYVFQAKEAIEYEYEELKHSFEAILNNLPGSVYWKDTEGRYLGCNKVVAKMAGFEDPHEIIGKTDYDLCWHEFAEEWQTHDRLVMQTDKQVVREESVRLASGHVIVELSYKMPLKDRFGKVLGIIGTSLDITKLKEIEASLVDAKEKAEVANRAKTEFLASMSHDMKTPLAGIVTTAEVIVGDKTAPERDKQYAAIIAASGKQLASFFTSCLDLSKMEMQEWASKIETFSLKQLVNDVAALFAPQALSKNLPLSIEYDETLPPSVEGHRESLYRVLLNLVGNALKFTEKGSITLRALRGDLINNQQVNIIFQVQDTGIGIPEDKHKIIFEKLKRLRPSYESQIEGSGIGLYIVDQYVKRLGGDIQVKSKVGEGSTFLITIPLKISTDKAMVFPTITPPVEEKIPASKAQSSVNISSAPKVDAKNTGKLPRVLVVEDTEVIQFVTKSLLNDAGFSVDIASTGEEAVEMFEPGKYGLIYMDIGLPKMTGYETAKVIRKKEQSSNTKTTTPIIALTGHGAVDVQTFCNDAGMQGILSKPLSREQAEMVWKHFKEGTNVSVPGLTLLTHVNHPAPSDSDILDVDATIKAIGVKDTALHLVDTFVEDLKDQFLPQIKIFISEHKENDLRFLLHRELGSLAYAKAPRLEKKLSDAQDILHKGMELDPAAYHDIEVEALRVIDCYKKMNLTQLQKLV